MVEEIVIPNPRLRRVLRNPGSIRFAKHALGVLRWNRDDVELSCVIANAALQQDQGKLRGVWQSTSYK